MANTLETAIVTAGVGNLKQRTVLPGTMVSGTTLQMQRVQRACIESKGTVC